MSDQKETVEIYGLCCPETSIVRYVGKSVNATKRIKAHLREAHKGRRHTPLYCWMRTLRAAPIIKILETVPEDEWQEAERRWIAELKPLGNLLNLAEGGDEPYCSPELRTAHGLRLKDQWDRRSPNEKRLIQLKRLVGKYLRSKDATEEMKAMWRKRVRQRPDLLGCFLDI